MERHCYINSLAQVSCQDPLTDHWLTSPHEYALKYVRALEPDTKGLILPSEARRMSRILKRAVATAITAVNESGIAQPDAIVTGTGNGCIENSEKFLIDINRFGETCLKPTLFMQSTHNTVSSLIAIILKCHGYNCTYSHKGISFDSALLDAWLQIKSSAIGSALVGSHDEVTPFLALVTAKTHPEYNFISEASVSSVISSTAPEGENATEIADIRILYRPDEEKLASLLTAEDKVILTGINGNALNDAAYDSVLGRLGHCPTVLGFKSIFGEGFSASAIAFYVAATLLRHRHIPQFLYRDGPPAADAPESITILNLSDSSAWSMIRLKRI